MSSNSVCVYVRQKNKKKKKTLTFVNGAQPIACKPVNLTH